MYKKFLLSFFVVGMLFLWFSKANVGSVNMRYCEDVEAKKNILDKTYFIQPGKEKELCIYFYTDSSPVEVVYGFPNSAFDTQWSRTCTTDMSFTNPFSKYFIWTGERKILITKDKPFIVKERILAPIGMSGELKWCIAYTVVGDGTEKKQWEIFSVVVRKTNLLTFFMGDAAEIKNEIQLIKNVWWAYSTNTKIKATLDQENNLVLWFLIKNNGNITQNVILSGKIYNMLGFEKSYESNATTFNPGETKEISVMVGIIPSYKWFFTIKTNIKNNPVFSFDVSSLKDELKQWSIVTEKATIYMFSWITLFIVVFILFVLIKLILPRKVKIVQQPTSNNQPTI